MERKRGKEREKEGEGQYSVLVENRMYLRSLRSVTWAGQSVICDVLLSIATFNPWLQTKLDGC